MGCSPAHLIQDAAEILIHELSYHVELNFSHFYDGADETRDSLLWQLGLTDGCYSAERLIDLAAFQLEEMGIVKTTLLSSQLADGYPDYRIEWTEDGPDIVASGAEMKFRDME